MAANSMTRKSSDPTHTECLENGNVLRTNGLTDDERLAQLGHQQELKRRFSLPALGALCLCLMATWEALSTVISAGLASGGPPCLFYNYIASFICSVCIAASLGEIASIYPTSGGQYHWAAGLSPAWCRTFLSYITGWVSIGGQIVFTASAAFAAGLQFQSCIIINHIDYQPERWQGMLFYWAVLLYAFAINVWGMKLMPFMNLVSGFVHVAAFIAILVVLGVLSDKNPASYVFADFQNNSGWASDGVSWLVGLQSVVYPFLGYDAASHLAEELHQPERNVPLAMVWSVVINGVIGFVYCIVLLFAAVPLDDLLNNPYGFPFMEIYIKVTKSPAGTTVMSLMICVIAVAATTAGLTSTSRTLWAFARDKGTPFHTSLSKVTSGSQIPLLAVILVTILELLLGLIYLGNSTAFNAILSMAIIGMYFSYATPIFCMLFHHRRNLKDEDFGYFRLGKTVGPVLNAIGLVWMTVAVVFSTFPTVMPATPQNMNYSIVVMAGWLIFGLIYFYWFGRRKFNVPLHGLSASEAIDQHSDDVKYN